MNGYLSAILDPSMPFVRNALFAGLLSAILFGTLGAVVTVKRIAGLAGAISHAVLGGIGMALYLSAKNIVPGLPPMVGALVFAVLAAAIIGFVSLKAKQREDTVINALWAIGMSVGVLFIAKTPGYADPMSYLFGNILLVSTRDLVLLAILDAVVVFLAWRYYPQIEASAFDEEFARVRGVPTDAVFIATLAVTAVAVVLLQTFVGIVMVIAMLTLPSGTAGYAAKNLAAMMVGGTVPAGAVVVVIAGAAFLSVSAIAALRRGKNSRKIRGGATPAKALPRAEKRA